MLRLALAALASAPLLLAQGSHDLDKTTPGTLGGTLQLQVRNAPANTLAMQLLSFTGGPTPLSLFVPGEARSVAVGTDLTAAWTLFATDGSGAAVRSLALPNSAGLVDLVLHWQTATLATGGFSPVGQIGNPVVTQCSLPGQGLLARANLLTGRSFAVAMVDRDDDAGQGNVVIAGGGTGTLTSATGLASVERWDFRRMSVGNSAAMTTARALHLGVALADGRWLLIGGADATGVVLASCEVYDPATNSFAATGSMATPRVLHAACRLADGRVMVAGGTSSLADTTAAITSTQSSVEIWNPATGTWSNGPALGGRRLAPALTRLANNQVLASGGVEVTFFFGVPIAAVSTPNVQRWNPATNAWSNGPNMPQGRAGHHYNQVTLDDGRVLLSGGSDVPSLLGAANAAPIAAAALYNPATNSWTTTTMGTARALHSATKLADGRVVVCGGAQGTLTTPVSIADVELFTPATNSWSPLPPLSGPRSGHAAERLPDGTVVLFGGQGASATVPSIETLRF